MLRYADGRTRRFRVSAEDSECYETCTLWAFLVARLDLDAQRTLDSRAEHGGVELKIVVDSSSSTRFEEFCDSGYYTPLNISALRTLTLQPTGYSAKCSIRSVLQMLAMVRSEERGVVVCLGELTLDGVPPRRYLAEYQKFADSLGSVGPQAEM
ncbi:hypothetical protein C8R44DRAFT_865334 [Mycena epipterygia]|nr:hypothetical protein C8R44DRAFT_865334 [Mycena epipterygia]